MRFRMILVEVWPGQENCADGESALQTKQLKTETEKKQKGKNTLKLTL